MKQIFLKVILWAALICIPLITIGGNAVADTLQQEINRARAAHAQKDYARVIQIYTTQISRGLPDSEKRAVSVYANRGLAYALSGKFKLAIKDYDKTIDLFVSRGGKLHGYFWNLRGRAYYFSGDLNRAIQDFETAVKYSPNNSDFKSTLRKLKARKTQK